MYAEPQSGVPKTHLELKYLGKTESHGKLFSSLVRYLNQDTERTHPLAEEARRLKEENQRLRDLLQAHGIEAG